MSKLTIEPPQEQQHVKRINSLESLWDSFVKMRGKLAPATLTYYRYYANKFIPFINEKRSLTRTTLVEWIQHLQSSGLSHDKINKTGFVVKSFIKWLKSSGYIYEDISDAIRPLNTPAQKEAKMFTEEEYNKIKAYCTGREWCQLHLWLIILGYRTGMSLVDCCHLRWCNVHLDDNGPSYITIYRIKTERLGLKSKCHIPIIPFTDLHKWLLFLKDNVVRYPRKDGINDYVHPDGPGFYACTFQNLRNDFKNIFVRAGIGKEKSFKHFRNSFCSNLVNSGAQIALICKMTGHNNVKTLLGYLKPDTKALQEELAKAFRMASDNGNTTTVDGLTQEKE